MRRLYILVFLCLLGACTTTQPADTQQETEESAVLSGDVRLRIIVRDTAVENPDEDRRSYYRVYIDKVEAGRTEIALESQRKKFETTVERNSHLLRIEKYVLDPSKERYDKLNNIEQPKPDYYYFDADTAGSRQTITVVHDVQTHEASFTLR